ncbi:uncharacterized protein V6R79_001489 [Siganus canaliculatus]
MVDRENTLIEKPSIYGCQGDHQLDISVILPHSEAKSPDIIRYKSDSDSCETPERLTQAPRILYPDVAIQRLLTAVSELTKEFRDLRQEFREFRQSCRCGQAVVPVGPQPGVPFNLPLCSSEALDQAEDNHGAMSTDRTPASSSDMSTENVEMLLFWKEETPHSLISHRSCKSGFATCRIGQGGLDALNRTLPPLP